MLRAVSEKLGLGGRVADAVGVAEELEQQFAEQREIAMQEIAGFARRKVEGDKFGKTDLDKLRAAMVDADFTSADFEQLVQAVTEIDALQAIVAELPERVTEQAAAAVAVRDYNAETRRLARERRMGRRPLNDRANRANAAVVAAQGCKVRVGTLLDQWPCLAPSAPVTLGGRGSEI